MSLFQALGVLTAIYTAWAAHSGEVYAKSGLWGRRVYKAESPTYFWMVIVVYAGLSGAMLTVF